MTISIELYIALVTSSILGLLFAVIALIVGSLSLSKIIGMEKSTHSVQMVPVDSEIDAHNKKVMEQWGTTEESIEEQQELHKEDLEKEMPEFYEDEPDVYSF